MIEVKDGSTRKLGETGFFSGITNDDYHVVEGVSSSNLSCLIESPHKINNVVMPSKAMDFGTAFHMFFLEKDLFNKTYGVMMEPSAATKAGKEEKDQIIKNYKIPLKLRDYHAMLAMDDAITKDESYDFIFDEDCEHYVEHSGFWIYEGVLCKFRPDYLFIKNGCAFIVDLKTIAKISEHSLKMAIADRSYHSQAAFYIDGLKAVTGIKHVFHINLFVEKPSDSWDQITISNNRLDMAPVMIPDEDLEQGRRKYHQAINNSKRFIGDDFEDLPGFSDIMRLRQQIPDSELPMFLQIGLPYFKMDDQNKLERSE